MARCVRGRRFPVRGLRGPTANGASITGAFGRAAGMVCQDWDLMRCTWQRCAGRVGLVDADLGISSRSSHFSMEDFSCRILPRLVKQPRTKISPANRHTIRDIKLAPPTL